MHSDLEFRKIIREIIENSEFKKTKYIIHHHKSVFHHSILVSYLSYKLAKKLNLDYKSAARAGLLHDFFLYDWRAPRKNRFFEKHGFTHAREALKNAKSNFDLNPIEEDAILKHMFPLNIAPPKTRISWLVTIVDKYVSISDYAQRYSHKLIKRS